jgi:hypothetical protein
MRVYVKHTEEGFNNISSLQKYTVITALMNIGRMNDCAVNISLSCLDGYTAEELDTKVIPFKQRQFRELQAEARHIQVLLFYCTGHKCILFDL